MTSLKLLLLQVGINKIVIKLTVKTKQNRKEVPTLKRGGRLKGQNTPGKNMNKHMVSSVRGNNYIL